jgi:hypothetical protein
MTCWSAGILTYIVVRTLGTSTITPQDAAFAGVIQAISGLCGAVILAYVGGNQAIDHKHGPEQEKEE